jgi:nucleoside-diphosphate-sugar epimerase
MPLQAPKNFEDLRKPSVQGSLSVLQACKANSVKRLVMTSHYGAINHVDELDRPDIYTEEVWSDLERENQDPVHKSKFMAEKAMWEAQKESPSSLELVTVCPTLLVGPSLMGTRPSITSDFIKKMMSNEFQGMYRVMFGLVDVRDAATAHLAAVESE